MTHPPVLSDAELAAYHEHGYVRLGKVAPDEEIEALCRRIDDIMLGKIRYDNMLMQLCPSAGKPELSTQTKVFKGSTLKYRKVQDLEQDPLFLPYIQHPLFRDITRKIIGEEVSAFRTMFFNKPAGQGVPINWHQDGAGGWKLSIPPKVTIWTALDATSVANGCLQIIPGSHKTMIPEKVTRRATCCHRRSEPYTRRTKSGCIWRWRWERSCCSTTGRCTARRSTPRTARGGHSAYATSMRGPTGPPPDSVIRKSFPNTFRSRMSRVRTAHQPF